MNGKELIKEAQGMQDELTEIRRRLHENAEIGFDLPKTTEMVGEYLQAYGYTPTVCGKAGLVAELGNGEGGVFLLRADMDGLPIAEKTGVPYACTSGRMHACGHDLHTAMLLGAAKLLKKREKEIKGKIRLLFQPAEELLQGAEDVIRAGVLEGVNGAMMAHVLTATPLPTGTLIVAQGTSAPAADFFRITVKGKSCHGSAPQNGVDALTAAAHIIIALQELSARELSVSNPAVLTVGTCQAGKAGNVIAGTAELNGTLRAFDERVRAQVKKRISEISRSIAKAFRTTAKTQYGGGCPTLVNDEKLALFTLETLRKTLGKNYILSAAELGGAITERNGGSEDFAYISQRVPSVMLALAAGEEKDGYGYPLHHPKVRFDERALPVGAAAYAAVAFGWNANA